MRYLRSAADSKDANSRKHQDKKIPLNPSLQKGEDWQADPFFKGVGIRTKRDAVLAVAMAVLVGLVVSFAIEYLQAYLPSRDSSMRDLITNGMGTFIGAGVGSCI